MNDDRTPMEKNRKAFERAYAAIPAITPTKETAWLIWKAALSAAPAQEPVAWRETALAFERRAMRVEYIIRMLVAAGHVAQEKVNEAFSIAKGYASPLPQEPQEGKALTDADQMRAEFEAWVQDRGCDTDGAWTAWQACWNLRGALEGKAAEGAVDGGGEQ